MTRSGTTIRTGNVRGLFRLKIRDEREGFSTSGGNASGVFSSGQSIRHFSTVSRVDKHQGREKVCV